jgi:hypothetical protein
MATMRRNLLLLAGAVGLAACGCSKKPEPETKARAVKVGQPGPAKGAARAKAEQPPTAVSEEVYERSELELPPLPGDAVVEDLKLGKIKVPKGAKAGIRIKSWTELKNDKGFSMSVAAGDVLKIEHVKRPLANTKLLVDEKDTVVWKKDGKLGFAAWVTLRPTAEGGEPHRFACRSGSPVDALGNKPIALFNRAQVDLMLASCRSIHLPPPE